MENLAKTGNCNADILFQLVVERSRHPVWHYAQLNPKTEVHGTQHEHVHTYTVSMLTLAYSSNCHCAQVLAWQWTIVRKEMDDLPAPQK